ncbi:MAG: hypothetical protein WBE52_18500 [Terriglobales bacterium]
MKRTRLGITILQTMALYIGLSSTPSQAQEPIVNVSDHQFNYTATTLPSVAAVGGKLYVAYQVGTGTTVNVEMFPDNSGKGNSQIFSSPGDGYRYPLIMAYNEKLYLLFMGADGHFNLTQLERNTDGTISAWTNQKQSSGWISPTQMSVAVPTSTGMVMLWQDGSKQHIASLNPVQQTANVQTKSKGKPRKEKKTIKALTQAEPIVNVSDHQFSYSGGTFPSMASVGGKLYVAYQAGAGTTVNVEMFPDNSGKGGSQTFSSPTDGYRYPWIVSYNGVLYLVFMGADGRFNLTVLERDATGKVVAWTNRKQTSGWMSPTRMSVAVPTSTGMVILWQDGSIEHIGSLRPK